MKLRVMNYNIILFFVLFAAFSCKTGGKEKSNIFEENYNLYEDTYENNNYYNLELELTMNFDDEWSIKTQYRHFDKFEKEYASYFGKGGGEVLLIGFNDIKKIGVRVTVENHSLTNELYFNKLKDIFQGDEKKYSTSYREPEEKIFKNIEAYFVIMDTSINKNNNFVFYSVFFNNGESNFKADFWFDKEHEEAISRYVLSIIDTIDFESLETRNIETPDLTDDKVEIINNLDLTLDKNVEN